MRGDWQPSEVLPSEGLSRAAPTNRACLLFPVPHRATLGIASVRQRQSLRMPCLRAPRDVAPVPSVANRSDHYNNRAGTAVIGFACPVRLLCMMGSSAGRGVWSCAGRPCRPRRKTEPRPPARSWWCCRIPPHPHPVQSVTPTLVSGYAIEMLCSVSNGRNGAGEVM